MVNSACFASSIPLSHVKDFRYCAGIGLNADNSALCTDSASLPANLRMIVKRDFRSTSVAIWVFFEPDTRSPSQWPTDLRLSMFLERSCIDTPFTMLVKLHHRFGDGIDCGAWACFDVKALRHMKRNTSPSRQHLGAA